MDQPALNPESVYIEEANTDVVLTTNRNYDWADGQMVIRLTRLINGRLDDDDRVIALTQDQARRLAQGLLSYASEVRGPQAHEGDDDAD